MAIVIRSSKMLHNEDVLPKMVVIEKVDDGVKPSAPIPIVVDDEFVNGDNMCVENEKEDEPPSLVIDVEGNKGDETIKGNVHKCPSPYAQRLLKKKEDIQFNFFDLHSKLSINIPLIDALLQMVGYEISMKELLKKKGVVDVGIIKVSH